MNAYTKNACVKPAMTQAGSQEMAIYEVGPADSETTLIWAHGWGLSAQSMMPMATALGGEFRSCVLDLPGFGASPTPPENWGTSDYADMVAMWLATQPKRQRIWIGHSYGCRVGLQLAARHPGVVDGFVLVAAAGLKRRRTLAKSIQLKMKVLMFKAGKKLLPASMVERLYAKAGSVDSRRAGPMRPIFVRAVNEDLTSVAAVIRTPTLLVYGREDDDTPPEIGERLKALIPRSELLVLNGFDHHTILTDGQHAVINEIRRFQDGL